MKKWHQIALAFLVVAVVSGVLAFLFTFLHAYDTFGEKHGVTKETVDKLLIESTGTCKQLEAMNDKIMNHPSCEVALEAVDFLTNAQESVVKEFAGCAFKGYCNPFEDHWYLAPCFQGAYNVIHNMLILPDPANPACKDPTSPAWDAVYEFWQNLYQGIHFPCCQHFTNNWEIVTGVVAPFQGKKYCANVDKPVDPSAGIYASLDACNAAIVE